MAAEFESERKVKLRELHVAFVLPLSMYAHSVIQVGEGRDVFLFLLYDHMLEGPIVRQRKRLGGNAELKSNFKY